MTSIRLLMDTVIPYRNGRHVPHGAGDVISISELAPALIRRISGGDALLARVLVVE